jgi:hypothetical protein
MKIQTAPQPTPPRNKPSQPELPPEVPAGPQPPADQVQLGESRPEKSTLQKAGSALVPALQSAVLAGVACAIHPAAGTLVGGIGGLMTGYHLGAGGGKFLAMRFAEGGGKAGGGAAIVGGMAALGTMFAGPVLGTVFGGLGGAVMPHVATPVVAAAVMGGATFVGKFLGESA